MLVLAVVVGVEAAGVRPAAASGAPVMGPSRLTAAQIAAWFRASTRSVYRASVPVEQLAADYVWEGNAANVRGDIAFAQSVLETGWFNFPASGYVALTDNNFAGIGAYGDGSHLFRAPDADTGVRGQIQLLRRYADRGSRQNNIGYPPVPQLWNPPSSYDTLNTTHGWAPTWADMSGTWASSTTYATSVLKIYNSMLLFAGLPGDCPPDSLAVGRVAFNTAGCPAALAQPGRAVAARPGGGTWVLNGNGQVQALDGAPSFGAPLFGWDIARDIAAMPDGNGYMVLDGFGGVRAANPFGWAQADRWRGIDLDAIGYLVLRNGGTSTHA